LLCPLTVARRMRDRSQVPLCREGHGKKAVRRGGGYETLPGRVDYAASYADH